MGKKALCCPPARKGGNSDLFCDQFMLGALERAIRRKRFFERQKDWLLHRVRVMLYQL